MPLRLSILLIYFLLPYVAHTQHYQAYAHRYGMADGLPHREIHAVLQDRHGFIWTATSGGVARFDGRKFRVFNHMEDGLHEDDVDLLAEDADGYIWVSHSSGNHWVDIIDPITGKITPFEVFFKGQTIPLIHEKWRQAPQTLPDGTLVVWLEDVHSFLLYHPQRGWRVSRLEHATFAKLVRTTSRQALWCVYQDTTSRQRSLAEIDLEGRLIRQYPIAPGRNFGLLKGPAHDPDGFFIHVKDDILGAEELWEIDGQGRRTILPPRFPTMATFQYGVLEHGNLLVQSPFIHLANGELLLDLTQEFPDLDSWQFKDFLVDRSGNLWFATTFGLVMVELRENHFRRLLYDDHAPGGRGSACRGLAEINGRLFVNIDNLPAGRFTVDLNSGDSRRLPGTEPALGISKSADGNLWTEWRMKPNEMSLNGVSLQKITPEGVPVGPLFQAKNKDSGFIWSMLETDPHCVLLGLGTGLMVLNPTTGAFVIPPNATFPEFDHARINSLQRDRSGQIWAITSLGLYRLKEDGAIMDRYWPGGKGDHHLPYENTLHLYEDADGIFWLGTAGGGLIRWDRTAQAGQQIQVISRKNGLLNSVVYAVYEDRHQHLWLPTDFGIAQFDKNSLRVRRTWVKEDGITHNEFNRISHGQGSDGTLYFGGLNGVTAFQPDDFYDASKEQKEPPALVSLAFQVYDGKTDHLEDRLPELLGSETFTMQPGDRYLQLEFALLDYVAPEKVTYYWYLEGVTSDWEVLNEPVLRLSGLSYGRHLLRLRAQASSSAWAKNELAYSIQVLPPVYLRWWFIAACVLMIALGIWNWMHWRTRAHRLEQERLEREVTRQTATIRLQTEELKRLDEAKSRFFANITHELRTPLTLMLGPIGTILKNPRLEQQERGLATVARQQGQHLLNLITELLDLSKLESGVLHVHETPVALYPFLHRLCDSFHSHAERLGIGFKFEYDLPVACTVSIDTDKVEKILNNLLSNALKFTPAHAGGQISIRVSETNGHVRILVSDTGRGIHPDDLPRVFDRFFQTSQPGAPVEGGSGIGLALCRELTQVLNGRIWAESHPGAGSDFYFEFPKKEVFDLETVASNGSFENKKFATPARLEAPVPPPGAPRILVVEDHESLRDYIRLILSGSYEVMTAENGHAALSLLERTDNLPDLILSDVMMPKMDGFQLLERLKGDDRWRHIPVVMLTARADLHDKLRALRIGVDDYLLKPFEEEELLARVGNLLQNAGRRSTPKETRTSEKAGEAVQFSADDLVWLEQFEQVVERRIPYYDLTADLLAADMAMSRSTLFRQLKRLTGLTPMEYVDEARFQKARLLLETRAVSSVKAAAYSVGLKQVKHFSLNYKKRFGKSPSEAQV
jgi:signal transduction histidine kinase/DNA-binding response OmpR family regulator